ncbi:MAG: sigma-70 family RNA polymerase sigma factor [Bacilli bacterium]|nr:sigma-70 family RNA polymerase sigma factor [Bacilli bacterium]
MAKHKVEITGLDTNKIKVLKNDEIYELLKKDINNQEVFDELVHGNLRLVLSVIKKYKDRFDNLDDLFQIGCIGLMKAIRKFDVSLNLKFSTYAVPMISGEIKRYLRDNNAIRISRQLKDIAYQALKLKDEYMMKNQMEPSNDEIAKLLNLDIRLINESMESIQQISSIYETVYEEDGDTLLLIDQIKIEDDKMNLVPYLISLKKGINNLTAIQKKIINDRYYLDKTQLELASEFGISQAQISRIEKNAIKVLKNYL